MSHHSSANITPAATEKSSDALLNKENTKELEMNLTDDFVVLTSPEKFSDTNINKSHVRKCHVDTPPINEIIDTECLLLSDTSEQLGTPRHVQNIFQHYESIELNQAEILFLLVYIVALESGFISQLAYEQSTVHVHPLSATCLFHSKNVLHVSRLNPNLTVAPDKTRFSISLRSLIDAEQECSDYTYALLTAFVTGDFFIVTLSPANATGSKGFSTSLSTGRYVLSRVARNKSTYLRFRKLGELSNILRDELFVPMRCQHSDWLGCRIYPSLNGLPAELYDEILKFLSKKQLKILANVNRYLNILIKSSKYMDRKHSILSSI